jgi:hypothetical protein
VLEILSKLGTALEVFGTDNVPWMTRRKAEGNPGHR